MQGTERPPKDLLLAAQRRARASGRALYLYCSQGAWRSTTRLRAVPPGASTLEVRPDPGDPDLNNTGGC